MSENSPKNVLFSFHRSGLNSFIQLCEEHCATMRHNTRFWRLFHSVVRSSLVHFFIYLFFYSLFLPFYFFPFNKSNFRCVFTKTIILLGLAEYEMIITNSALRASLVIYHLIFGAPS